MKLKDRHSNAKMQASRPNTRVSSAKEERVRERVIQKLWRGIALDTIFTVRGGKKIEIISPGTWNHEEGPDFLNAMLRADGKIIKGDVEIHNRSSDWQKHAHSENPDYSNVILHAVMIDDIHDPISPQNAYLLELPFSSTPKEKETTQPSENFCQKFFHTANDQDSVKFLIDAGIERFRNKSTAILSDMIGFGSDKAFLKFFFDAFGYKKNRAPFAELFSRFSEYGKAETKKYPSIILWGESGLLPDHSKGLIPDGEMHSFISESWKKWWPLRKSAREKILWARNAIRPLNSPERRIAALGSLLETFENAPLDFLIDIARLNQNPSAFWKGLKNDLKISHPLWERHASLESPMKKAASLAGESFMLGITLNVILPALYAYSALKNDKPLGRYALDAYLSLPPEQDNSIIRAASEKWFAGPEKKRTILNSAVSHQGVLHIYKEFCDKAHGRCAQCLLSCST